MDFNFSDEQIMLRDSVAKFIVQDYNFDTRKKILASATGFSEKNWQLFAELGWLMVPFTENDGGLGGTAVDIIALMEELGKGLVVEPILATAIIAGGLIAAAANEQQKQILLTPLLEGKLQYAFAYAEPQSRYDLNNVATTAELTEQGFNIRGEKSVVLNAQHADVLIVSVRTQRATTDRHGISLLWVPKDTAGITIKPYATVDGFQAAEVFFHDAVVAQDNLLGPLDEALPRIESAIDRATLAICAEAVGAMEISLKKTVDYSRTRKQFGVPIGSFQALQHRMAEMFIELEQAKSMLLMAAMQCDAQGKMDAAAISAAKYRIGKAARRIGQESIQIHGGIGVTDELDVGHYFKRLTTFQLTFGSTDYHGQRYADLTLKPE